jgi:phosphatidylglycerol phospholipase C
MSIPEARKHFFKHVHGFSVRYEYLASAQGERFRKECAAENKGLCVWTVNGREEMRNCARWGVKSVISDKPDVWREIKKEVGSDHPLCDPNTDYQIIADRKRALQPTLQTLLMPYIQYKNWWFDYERQAREETAYLEREGGKFDDVVVPEDVSLKIIRPSDMLPSLSE